MVSVTADKMVMESKWNAHHGKITSRIMVEDNLLSASVEDKNVSCLEYRYRRRGFAKSRRATTHSFIVKRSTRTKCYVRKYASTVNLADGESVNTQSMLMMACEVWTAVVILRDSATGMKVVSI